MSDPGQFESARKIMSHNAVADAVAKLKTAGKRVVFTNGCFDIMHPGHVQYLEQARSFGDALVVALNSDVSVRALKGPTRPIVGQDDRAILLAALECVDFVTLFDEMRVTGVIEQVKPSIYVKGGDYTLETLDKGERAALEACGAEIRIVPLLDGLSTTDLIARILKVCG